jgi:hypothetical protein
MEEQSVFEAAPERTLRDRAADIAEICARIWCATFGREPTIEEGRALLEELAVRLGHVLLCTADIRAALAEQGLTLQPSSWRRLAESLREQRPELNDGPVADLMKAQLLDWLDEQSAVRIARYLAAPRA